MSSSWYNIIKEINQDAAAAAESERVMKIYYEVEYTRKSNLKPCADVFPTKSAAFRLTRDPSIIWERVLEILPNGAGRIILENPDAERLIFEKSF